MKPAKRPVVLIVRDGWGKNPDPKWNSANAVFLAKHPTQDRMLAEYPWTLVKTSGFAVGLPEGTMGNSEVGHQNLGAGRIVDQESVRITKAIRSGEFFDNPVLASAMQHVRERSSSLHLFGLVSDAGVHALLEHLYACVEMAKRQGVTKVFVHAFGDGRDTSPESGINFIRQIEAKLKEIGIGQIASVCGRFWAMDRDNRWDRVQKAYRMLTLGEGARFRSAEEAVLHYYANPTASNLTGDEFITPSLICDDGATPRAIIKDSDAVIFVNYRGDRPREITRAFVMDTFPFSVKDKETGEVVTRGFERAKKLDLFYVTMTAYESSLPVKVAYPKPPKMVNILGEYFGAAGIRQFRCAETEKFPHVTFFFNDYREDPFTLEERQIIPSPKVQTYDQQPEMSAPAVADEVVKRIASERYDFMAINFANGDMVGHTGVLPAAVKAVEAVDAAVGKVLEAVQRQGGIAIVTADHGNCEQMIDPETGGPHTAHTTYDVELVVVDDRLKGRKLREGGSLCDVAPTFLELMAMDKPAQMLGKSLL